MMPKNFNAENDLYWGACPTCGENDGYCINIGKGHWYYCSEHRVRWFVGANLFSGWRDQTEEQQREASRFFFEGADGGYTDLAMGEEVDDGE